MDFSKILAELEQGVKFAEQLTPILEAIPGAGPMVATAVNAVGAVTDVVTNLTSLVEEGKIVATSNDVGQLKDLISRLQKANDDLAAYIDAH